MKLRWYQREAVAAIYAHLKEREDNPCVVMPTGAGKSPTIAQVARDTTILWGGRCLVLAHRKELLQQNAEKLWLFEPELEIGIYSAGLKRRDSAHPVIFAGIQSVYTRAAELGHFDLVLVDEAHLIPPDGEGMYRAFLAALKSVNEDLRVVGFTATPYRTKGGAIAKPDGILNHVCYEAPLAALIMQGFLTKLVSYAGTEEGKIDTEDVATRAGEFVAGQLELKALVEGRVAAAVKDVLHKCRGRRKVLLFCTSVRHAEHVALELGYHTDPTKNFPAPEEAGKTALVVGTTPGAERDAIVKGFRNGKIKFLVNVEVFCEGLDVPDIDTIVLLRPTKSPGLFVQMVGRGFRVAPGKDDCLILDFGDNVLRHGPVDRVTAREPSKGKGVIPAKECPQCHALLFIGVRECPECGHAFPEPVSLHNRTASDAPIMSMPPSWVSVDRVSYHVHSKFGAPPEKPKTVRVDYHNGICFTVSEWVCVEHDGYARTKAMTWWGKRQWAGGKVRCPLNAAEAVKLLQAGEMRESGRILVKNGTGPREFDKIVEHELRLRDGSLMSDFETQVQKETEPEEDVPF